MTNKRNYDDAQLFALAGAQQQERDFTDAQLLALAGAQQQERESPKPKYDDAEIIALANARRRAASPENTGIGRGFWPGVNSGIVNTIGPPLDAAHAVRNPVLGLLRDTVKPYIPSLREEVKPSEAIHGALAQYGRAVGAPMVLPRGGVTDQTLSEAAGSGLGGAAVSAIGGAGALNMLQNTMRNAGQATYPVARDLVRNLYESVTKHPIQFLAGEGISGMGSGVGGLAASRQNPNLAPVGEVVGGLAPPLIPSVARAVLNPIGYFGGKALKTFFPWSKTGSQDMAAGRLQGLVADPLAAAAQVDTPTISNLTSAQQVGDPNLLRLERLVADRSPALRAELEQRAIGAQETLIDEARKVANLSPRDGFVSPWANKISEEVDPKNTRTFLQGRMENTTENLDARLARSQEEFKRSMEDIKGQNPGASKEELGEIFREIHSGALQKTLDEEKRLWGKGVSNIRLPIQSLMDYYNKLTLPDTIGSLPDTEIHNISPYIREFLTSKNGAPVRLQTRRREDGDDLNFSKLAPVSSIANLQGFRSELLKNARIATKNKEFGEAKISNDFANETLYIMNNANPVTIENLSPAGVKTLEDLEVARAFTSKKIATFHGKNKVGNLSNYVPGSEPWDGDPGIPTVPVQESLTTTIGRGGVKGGVAESQLMRAVDNDPEARQAIADYLTRISNDTILNADNKIKPQLALNWLRNNENILKRYPEIETRVRDALKAQRMMNTVEAKNTNIIQQLSKSPIKTFTEGRLDDAVSRIFKTDDPVQSTTALRRSAAKDSTGKASEGLRIAFINDLLKRGKSTSSTGEFQFNGSDMIAALKDPTHRSVFEKIFTPPEMGRLGKITQEFNSLERMREASPLSDIINESPSTFVRIVANFVAAQAGQLSASPLQTSGMMVRASNWFLKNLTNTQAEKLLIQSVTDPELFAILMRHTGSQTKNNETFRRLNSWLAGPAGRSLLGPREEKDEEPDLMKKK